MHQIQDSVRHRGETIVAAHPDWPCRKGCDECCRSLASAPLVTAPEWQSIAAALNAMPHDAAELLRARIRNCASASRPVCCPFLDTASGACLVYEARPIACREYGFYAERQYVLGCHRIETIAAQSPDVVWGNHESLQHELDTLGAAAALAEWLSHSNPAQTA